jgi:hypothetical protein
MANFPLDTATLEFSPNRIAIPGAAIFALPPAPVWMTSPSDTNADDGTVMPFTLTAPSDRSK